MSETISKSSAAERREARRLKILQNMDSRLKKITNVPSEKEVNAVEFKFDVKGRQSCKNDCTTEFAKTSSYHKEEPLKPPATEEWSPIPTSTTNYVEEQVGREESFLLKALYSGETHLIFVAILAYLLLSFGYGFLIYENVLVPFYTLELLKICLLRKEPKTGLLSIVIPLLTMYGMKNKVLLVAADISYLVLLVGRDLCLYLFVIILSKSLFV